MNAFLGRQQSRVTRIGTQRLLENRLGPNQVFRGNALFDLLEGVPNRRGSGERLTALGINALELFVLEVSFGGSVQNRYGLPGLVALE